jgi:hypothetical protein
VTVKVSDGRQLSQATMLMPALTGHLGWFWPVTAGEVQTSRAPLPW